MTNIITTTITPIVMDTRMATPMATAAWSGTQYQGQDPCPTTLRLARRDGTESHLIR